MKITKENYIDQLQQHNEKALLYVIDEYGGLLKAVIAKSIFPMQRYWEECMNDVLLAIWDNIDSFQPEKSNFKNWIASIARYKSIDYLRKHQRELLEVPLDQTENDSLTDLSGLENTDVISEEMEKLLSCLSLQDRELFMRLYVKEETVEEISQSAKLSKPVIYNHISRAKKKLRKRKEGRLR